uniref:Uncharacterized protein n=1 Tax=Arundo donax TaxID=35708 RepID=A0A0A9SVZ1_ARUDO
MRGNCITNPFLFVICPSELCLLVHTCSFTLIISLQRQNIALHEKIE